MAAQSQSYRDLWNQADTLQKQKLPKSALDVVNTIYTRAVQAKNTEHAAKAFIRRMVLEELITEDAENVFITRAEEELDHAWKPYANVMHSILGEMYFDYFTRHQWQLLENDEMSHVESDDLKNWSRHQIVSKIRFHYLASLTQADDLQKIQVHQLGDLLVKGTKSAKLRPTLYDLLAWRAIDVFLNPVLQIDKQIGVQMDSVWFGDADFFIDHRWEESDTLSIAADGVNLMRQVLAFRKVKSEQRNALLDADLNRLNKLFNLFSSADSAPYYWQALERLEEEASESSIKSLILFCKGRCLQYYPDAISFLDDNIHPNKRALELFNKCLKEWPGTEGAILAGQAKEEILRKGLDVNTEEVLVPDRPIPFLLEYRNVSQLHVKVFKVDSFPTGANYHRDYKEWVMRKIKTHPLCKEKIQLPEYGDHLTHSAEWAMDVLPIGSYLVCFSLDDVPVEENNLMTTLQLHVSNLSGTARKRKDGDWKVLIANRTTGQPVQGAKVTSSIYKGRYSGKSRRQDAISISDESGFVSIPSSRFDSNLEYSVEKGSDCTQKINTWGYVGKSKEAFRTKLFLFSDRRIYRPGQTVFFKGILLKTNGQQVEVLEGEEVEIHLKDVNYRNTQKLSLSTNEFGSVSGQFKIPVGVLTGSWQLHSNYGELYFSVEEYKLSKFTVEIFSFDSAYVLGQEVFVDGQVKALAGNYIDGAQVKYNVSSISRYSTRQSGFVPGEEIAIGTCSTDSDGKFRFSFKTEGVDALLDKGEVLQFHINSDVIDVNGESQSGQAFFNIGRQALKADIQCSQVIWQDDTQKEVGIIVTNQNGRAMSGAGKLIVYRLEESGSLLPDRYWQKPDTCLNTGNLFVSKRGYWDDAHYGPGRMMRQSVSPEKKIVCTIPFQICGKGKIALPEFKSWPTGRYQFEVKLNDPSGELVQNYRDFMLLKMATDTIPVKEYSILQVNSATVIPGDTLQLLVGSDARQVQAYLEVAHGNRMLLNKVVKLNSSQEMIQIPIDTTMCGELSINLFLQKDNRFFQRSEQITIPFSHKELEVQLASHRDKSRPGNQEDWQVTIKGKQGEQRVAEFLATLYDVANDKLVPNQWYFDPFYSSCPNLSWRSSGYQKKWGQTYNGIKRSKLVIPLLYDQIDWFGKRGSYRSIYRPGELLYIEDEMELDEELDFSDLDMEEEEMPPMKGSSGRMPITRQGMVSPPPPPPRVSDCFAIMEAESDDDVIALRSDFQETAFFYPHLNADSVGNTVFSFTLPESVTRWRFMGLAHTIDGASGLVESAIETQKELMVMPNLPRFLREGDKIFLTAKVVNLSDKKLRGIARLDLIDPYTNKPISISGLEMIQPISIDKSGNTSVRWEVNVPLKNRALIVRMSAEADDFSDGEEHLLPVLPSKIMVTEAMPFTLVHPGRQVYELANLKNSQRLEHEQFTISYRQNVVWEVIKALPYLSEYPYECAEQTFSRYFSYVTGHHLFSTHPAMAQVVKQWNAGLCREEDALVSPLMKNEQLKSIAKEEMPWLMQGESESRQRQNLGLFTDENYMADQKKQVLFKLRDMQFSDGSFPWFNGMSSSRYMTQHILAGFGYLLAQDKGLLKDPIVKSIVKGGIHYLDHQLEIEAKEIQDIGISSFELSEVIHLLYARSFFTKIDFSDETSNHVSAILNQLVLSSEDRRIVEDALLALVCNRFKRIEVAVKIIQSLKERAIRPDEHQMYFKLEGAYWYNHPVESQAIVLEAFSEIAPWDEDVKTLTNWLVNQKRTQAWSTTKSTVLAINAILKAGKSELLLNSGLDQIKFGKSKIEFDNWEAGSGYVSKTVMRDQIKPYMGKITIDKKSNGVSWGSLHWSYFQEMDEVRSTTGPLIINKQIYVERNNEKGLVFVPLEKSSLKIGDKIKVRLMVKAENNMEYIHIKDQRAACFEPLDVLSGYRWSQGLGYYQSIRDASMNFFIDQLPKGTHYFEYHLRVAQSGVMKNGISTVQCMYSPEYTSHTQSLEVVIETPIITP